MNKRLQEVWDGQPRVPYLLLQAFIFLIPISQFLSMRLLVIIAAISLVSLYKSGSWTRVVQNAWDLWSYFIFLCVGVLYSTHWPLGLRELETNIGLLLLPIAMQSGGTLTPQKLIHIFIVFVVGLMAASLIFYANGFLDYLNTSEPKAFFGNRFLGILDFDSTYYAYYLILAITFGLYLIYFEEPSKAVPLILFVTGYLFILLIITGAITTFLGMLLVFAFFILRYLRDPSAPRRTYAFSLVLAMSVIMFAATILFKDWQWIEAAVTDLWQRSLLWKSALAATPNWLYGAGKGDYHEMLNQYFSNHGLASFAQANYNAHNQYAQEFLSGGILGLGFLVVAMIRPLYQSLTHQYVLGGLIFFLFFVFGITEVFLGRYQGVVFFAFMHQLFVKFYKDTIPKAIR